MDIILKYFPELTDKQKEQFAALYDLYTDWNAKINVISRKDITNLYEHHVLHSLGIAKIINFRNGTQIMDLGTGGGFPGIPLKIAFPDLKVTLLDSLQKRIRFLDEVIVKCNLKGTQAVHGRAEDYAKPSLFREKYDLCVSRAVANLSTLSEYCLPFVKKDGVFIALKGPDVRTELSEAQKAIGILGGKVERVVEYKLGDVGDRTLILIRKISHTSTKYPRNTAKIKKQPLN